MARFIFDDRVHVNNLSAAQLTVSAGTSAVPAISPTGDTNTGIFFPAADTIAFAEGGTEAMRIDSSGRVGIGITAPTAPYRLDVSTAARVGGAFATIALTDPTGGITNGGFVRYISNGATGSYIYQINTAAAGDFTTATNAVTITSAGNVGIGTTSPTAKLDVNGGAIFRGYTEIKEAGFLKSDTVAAYNALVIKNTSGVEVQLNANGNFEGNLRTVTNHPLSFSTNNTQRLNIASGGNIYFPGAATTASAANAVLNSGSTPANELLRSTSSLRYKTQVEDMWDVKGDLIYSLRPVWYRSLCTGDRHDWSWYGLIAEEVAEVEPRLVTWTYLPEDYHQVVSHETITTEISGVSSTETTPVSTTELKPDAVLRPDGVQYDRLTIFLIKAVQELKEIVDTQSQTISSLNIQLSTLQQHLSV